MAQVTDSQLLQLNSRLKNAADLAASINEAAARFSIDQSLRRLRYFVAQSFFETMSYTTWVENLTYTTPQRLVAVWPNRFTMNQADTTRAYAPSYINNPQKLAGLVYGGRLGNGVWPASNDAYTYRGRGGFHLTGQVNYNQYSIFMYGDLRIVDNPDLVAEPTDAFMSAGWFWQTRGLNQLADQDAYTKATVVINGSASTVPQRLQVLNQVNQIIT